MAEDVIAAGGSGSTEPAQATTQPLQGSEQLTRSERGRRSAYRNRFVAVYFGLAIVLGTAVGALAVALRSPDATTAKPAKPVFRPATSGELGATDLASNVQRNYRRVGGAALVDIVATRNTLQNGNLGLLRVRYQVVQPVDSAKDRDSRLVVPTDALQYSLCGTDAQCAIPGTPSVARLALLRREGLELAIRSFQNDPKVDNVVVFVGPVPPPQGSSFEGYALMFSRGSIEHDDPALLTRPLATTLPGAGSKITANQLTQDQVVRIGELTRPYLYLYRYQLLGGRDAAMYLQPATA